MIRSLPPADHSRLRPCALPKLLRAVDFPPADSPQSSLDPSVPDYWRAVDLPSDFFLRLCTVRATLQDDEQRPFQAAELDAARIRSVLQSRVGPLDSPAPLPNIPVEVSDVFPDGRHISPFRIPCRRLDDTAAADFALACDLNALFPVDPDTEALVSISPLFSVCQESKTRLIFDLRALNSFALEPGFAMETLLDVPALAACAKFACKIDLRKAFWQVPLTRALSLLLGCRDAAGRVWAWRSLPFGLSHSPRIFSALMHAFRDAWRKAGLNVLVYLDDILILSRSLEEHVTAVEVVVHDLLAAGIRISCDKAFLRPYEVIDFLGLTADLPHRSFSVPPSKRSRIAADASALLNAASVSTRQLQAFLGRLAFVGVACPHASAFRTSLLQCISPLPDAPVVVLSEEARAELMFWCSEEARNLILDRRWPWARFAKTRLYARRDSPALVPSFVAWGDASDFGAGLAGDACLCLPAAESLPAFICGVPVAATSSTVRELWVILRLVQLSHIPAGSSLRVFSDNNGAVANANGSSVCAATAPLVRMLLRESLARDITIYCDWVPREELADVDARSRWFHSLEHAQLPSTDYERIWSVAFGGQMPELDLFSSAASRIGSVLAGSRTPEADSVGDALSLDPARFRSIWAFPPFALVAPFCRWLTSHAASLPVSAVCVPDTSMTRAVLAQLDAMLIEPPSSVMCPPGYTFERRAPAQLLLAVIKPRAAPRRARLRPCSASPLELVPSCPIVFVGDPSRSPALALLLGEPPDRIGRHAAVHDKVFVAWRRKSPSSHNTASAPVFVCNPTYRPLADGTLPMGLSLRRLTIRHGVSRAAFFSSEDTVGDDDWAQLVSALGPAFQALLLPRPQLTA
jgi:hypothetical protein